ITSIDFDHQQFLGDTIEAIAWEKAGVIRSGTFCVLATNGPAVRATVARRCREVGADLIDATAGTAVSVEMRDGRARIHLRTPTRAYGQMTLALRGRHQVQNAIAAVRALEELDRRGVFRVPPEAVRTAVEDVIWPGR